MKDTMVHTAQPAFQVGEHKMHHRQVLFRHFGVAWLAPQVLKPLAASDL